MVVGLTLKKLKGGRTMERRERGDRPAFTVGIMSAAANETFIWGQRSSSNLIFSLASLFMGRMGDRCVFCGRIESVVVENVVGKQLQFDNFYR